MKLSTKILLFVFTLSLVPTAFVVAFFYEKGSERLEEKVILAGDLAIDGISYQFSDFFLNRQDLIKVLSESEEIKSMDWNKAKPLLTSKLSGLNENFEKIIIGRPDGRYYSSKGGNPALGNLVSFDDEDPEAVPKTLVKREYWQETVRRGFPQSHISEPIISYSNSARQIILAQSIVGAENKVVGMLGGSVSWELIEKKLARFKKELTEQFNCEPKICLMSDEGTYIYHWDDRKALSYLEDKDGVFELNDIGEPEVVSFNLLDEGSDSLVKAWEALTKGKRGYVMDKRGDSEFIFWYMPIEGTRYCVGLEMPTDQVFSVVGIYRYWLIGALCLFVVIVLIFSLWFSQTLTRRINALNLVAENYQRESIDYQAELSSDEIGDLSRSLKRIVDETFNQINFAKDKEDEYRIKREAAQLKLESRNKDLKETLQELENSSREKSEFLTKASQDLKTPISVILSSTHRLRNEDLSYEVKGYLANIESSTEAMMALINDLRDFAKLDGGDLELVKEKFNMADLLQDVCGMFTLRTESKGLQFKCELADEAYQDYIGDSVRVKQVILNYLSNAFKFTERGSIELNVLLQVSNDYEDDLLIEVKDTGVGVDETLKKQLFKQQELSNSYNGSQLGLSIVNRLVHLMGGNVGVMDNDPKGAIFWASVKLQKDLSLNKKKELMATYDLEETVTKLKENEFRALVVDDNKMNLKLAKMILSKIGLEVELVNSAQEALNELNKSRYDVVFMDCMMPEMDGYQATRAIRDLEALGTYKEKNLIIALTANVLPEDVKRCLDSGMDAHVGKPIDRNELIMALAEYLLKA